MKPFAIRNQCAALAILVAMLEIASMCPKPVAAFSPPNCVPKLAPPSPRRAFPLLTGNALSNPRKCKCRSPSPSATFASRPNIVEQWRDAFSNFLSSSSESDRLYYGSLGVFVSLLVVPLVINSVFYVVDAGEVGISSTLGSIERQDPGPHIKAPLLTSVTKLSTKTTLLEQSNFVPTKEGLTVELDTAVLVKLDPDSALELYRSVGPDFITKIVTPEASSSVRGLTSESEAKVLYTSGRSELQNRLRDELTEKLSRRGVLVEDVLLKNVILPEALSKSIQEKARAEQESARMEFVLQKESQEARRKAIEAEGIADFQRIVSDGITPSMLQWKGIEATEKLAKSPNSKVVIVGNSKDSLPIILGNDGK